MMPYGMPGMMGNPMMPMPSAAPNLPMAPRLPGAGMIPSMQGPQMPQGNGAGGGLLGSLLGNGNAGGLLASLMKGGAPAGGQGVGTMNPIIQAMMAGSGGLGG